MALAGSLLAAPLLFHDHGHGLAFSPDGKALLAPGDRGLAAYEGGVWWEGEGPSGGFSAFSVSERAMYSSGHGQSHAGLLRSVDNGRSWQPLALRGETDFRYLAAGYRSNAIYVLNNVLNTQPTSTLPLRGLYVTFDEGKSWQPAAANGLGGEIHGMAAHPEQARTLAVATGLGLYVSRDAGESFRRLGRKGAVTAVAFDREGKRLRYARPLSGALFETSLEGRRPRELRLPALEQDYVTCLAQNPTDDASLALATRRRQVDMTSDGGASWRLIGAGKEEDSIKGEAG
jgi:photosystem II stability/assembly factor-like uncharacterized protein